jgi:hypothetical protein
MKIDGMRLTDGSCGVGGLGGGDGVAGDRAGQVARGREAVEFGSDDEDGGEGGDPHKADAAQEQLGGRRVVDEELYEEGEGADEVGTVVARGRVCMVGRACMVRVKKPTRVRLMVARAMRSDSLSSATWPRVVHASSRAQSTTGTWHAISAISKPSPKP